MFSNLKEAKACEQQKINLLKKVQRVAKGKAFNQAPDSLAVFAKTLAFETSDEQLSTISCPIRCPISVEIWSQGNSTFPFA